MAKRKTLYTPDADLNRRTAEHDPQLLFSPRHNLPSNARITQIAVSKRSAAC